MRASPWPLAELEVITPVLRLCHVTDELADQLARLAAQGIHDPATMPFSVPWTDAVSPELERNTVQYFRQTRAEVSTEHWDVPMAVIVGDAAVGVCVVTADGFPARRTVSTGSWLGRRYQGRGLGREMRTAALQLIFAGFDADLATTRAWHDNAASLGVTRSLPYVQTGSSRQSRRGVFDTMLEFTMTRDQWKTLRRDDIQLVGVDAVLDQLALRRN
ncbi:MULTISPECIES: GNAT family N-acetyltransferase [Mycobacteriaceae]|uniref:N-acetyltransferase n=1 Tax=Mycolicibacterium mucogenicum DSM 44124 TaxID=1226753 RepID=A0A8H2JGM5_MYCMU|nr:MULTISPECIES: GNAT family protein [Mycobacteriaceae]KAB7752205.1 succinyl-CoA transferase [Mycolicibacterium mucogenicum DSM 44124]QPG68700.1 GNAT family N-acetyltransferase [Mycolicibacterium mucogenicum DSM 44124]SEB23829.1 Protein N-acetyltransferase, RimJ/RimL family [Mycobacterium sp. 283mftsu]